MAVTLGIILNAGAFSYLDRIGSLLALLFDIWDVLGMENDSLR